MEAHVTALELAIIWAFLGGMVVAWIAQRREGAFDDRWFELVLAAVSWPAILYAELDGDNTD